MIRKISIWTIYQSTFQVLTMLTNLRRQQQPINMVSPTSRDSCYLTICKIMDLRDMGIPQLSTPIIIVPRIRMDNILDLKIKALNNYKMRKKFFLETSVILDQMISFLVMTTIKIVIMIQVIPINNNTNHKFKQIRNYKERTNTTLRIQMVEDFFKINLIIAMVMLIQMDKEE